MSFAVTLLAPLALLLPGAVMADAARDEPVGQSAGLTPVAGPMVPGVDAEAFEAWQRLADAFRPAGREQVRIEQHVIIRVAPRARAPRSNPLTGLPDREIGPNFEERPMGRCLPIGSIAGVQVNGQSRLILFLRDQRIVSAALERSCNARDFYSGFYVERNSDGMLCARRDHLQSRSGANCTLTHIRQLVPVGD